jgi:hypothetical protein
MIADAYKAQIASELSALGGTPDQVGKIGEIVFIVAALQTDRDTEYLLEQMQDPDPLIKRACKIILEGLR